VDTIRITVEAWEQRPVDALRFTGCLSAAVKRVAVSSLWWQSGCSGSIIGRMPASLFYRTICSAFRGNGVN
jgi:hypothetical protein